MNSKGTGGGPQFVRFFGPVVEALHKLGGSARPAEVYQAVATNLNVSDEVQSETLPSGASRFNNQIAWARFYLGKAGLLDTSRRGVWMLTEKGRSTPSLTEPQALELFRAVQAGFPRTARKQPAGAEHTPGPTERVDEEAPPSDGAAPAHSNHRLEALRILRGLPPEGFEQFCQRLLRESNFEEVTVTGRSGDGGVDGIGLLKANALVSFKVVFQCKKYSGPVGASQVRDFRGAMMGRADKGIVLTTGTFTTDAKREAVRDGVPPIELVDGEKLLDLMENLELGLTPVKAYAVEAEFFEEFQTPNRDRAR
jgi:restriction system protein